MLRNRQLDGHKFRRQTPIAHYIVDFVCVEQRLIIEVDGGQHQDRANDDDERTRILEAEGYRVLRFWNNEVLTDLEATATAILIEIENHP